MSMKDKGSVYLASTESELKKGWIKCGMTTRSSKTRISEGNVASVREKYEMLYTKETEHYIELEKHMHSKFENQKEWIKASLPEAVAEINRFINSKKSDSKKIEKYNPKKHQKDAIDAVVKEAKVNDKVSIVMPTEAVKH